MLARMGWIGTALATGLLLQIAVQIHALHWLPDFPIYLGLAMLSAAAVLLAAPIATAAAVRNSSLTGKSSAWLQALTLGGFAVLTLSHAILAVKSSSTALERWRDVMLWPALLAGVIACMLVGARWRSLIFIWPLGEAATAILACWYAPSWGESKSFHAYRYVLVAAFITVMLLSTLFSESRSRRSWALWAFVLMTVALALTCLIQPDTSQAQGLLLRLSVLRLAVLIVAVNSCFQLAPANSGPGR